MRQSTVAKPSPGNHTKRVRELVFGFFYFAKVWYTMCDSFATTGDVVCLCVRVCVCVCVCVYNCFVFSSQYLESDPGISLLFGILVFLFRRLPRGAEKNMPVSLAMESGILHRSLMILKKASIMVLR